MFRLQDNIQKPSEESMLYRGIRGTQSISNLSFRMVLFSLASPPLYRANGGTSMGLSLFSFSLKGVFKRVMAGFHHLFGMYKNLENSVNV